MTTKLRIIILGLLVLPGLVFAGEQPEGPISDGTPFDDALLRELSTEQTRRVRSVLVDTDQIGGPDVRDGAPRIFLDLFDDVSFFVSKSRFERRSEREYSWFGQVAGDPGSSVILTVRGDVMTGKIFVIGATYGILSIDDDPRHAIREIDPGAFTNDEPPMDDPPGEPAASVDPTPTRTERTAPVRDRRRHRDAPSVLPMEFPDVHKRFPTREFNRNIGECSEGDFIDVLVVYTEDADDLPGDILTEIQNGIDDANESYVNSDIVQRLRLVGVAEVDYAETGDSVLDRDQLKDPGDGQIDDVHTLRDSVGADLVSLWTATGDWCGFTFIMSTVENAFEDRAFSVTTVGCAVDNHTFAHELGHNMGARHDRFVDNTDGQPNDYNHGFVNIEDEWRTIMAYNDACEDAGTSCTRLQYWSNPDILYDGDPMGIAEGDPEAADNARTLDETRTTVQGFRAAEAPVADAGEDQVGECGQPVTLDGSASCDPQGDPLSYDWSGPFNEGGGMASGSMPVVTFPKGIHTVNLVVNDGAIDSAPDTVEIDTEADLTPPELDCPIDQVIDCTEPTDPGNTGTATADDACDADPDVDFADEVTPGDCPQESTIARTWTATDDDGNASMCTQTIEVDDSTAPTVTVPDPITLECNAPGGVLATDPAIVAWLAEANAVDDCGDATLTNDAPDLFPFSCPPGDPTTVTFTGTDECGNSASETSDVTVLDTTPPVVDCSVENDELWPPNHKMVDVGFQFSVFEICDADPAISVTVTSDEDPDEELGSGGKNHCPDAIIDENGVQLAAERAGTGDGRVYVITVTVTDDCGNVGACSATVGVPHDQRPGGEAVDSGQAFDATVCDAEAGPESDVNVGGSLRERMSQR